MKMYKIMALSLCFISTTALAVRPIVVSKNMFGEQWPFKRAEMMLECRQGSQLFAINEGTLARYALNEEARIATMHLRTYIPLEEALKENEAVPGTKMDHTVIAERAATLCE